MSKERRSRFRIRPIGGGNAEPPQPPQPPEPPQPPQPPPANEDLHAGGLFDCAADALALLGAVSGAALAYEADAHRSDDGLYMVAVTADPARVAPLVSSARGQPVAHRGDGWRLTNAAGADLTDRAFDFDAHGWHSIGLRELLDETALASAAIRPHPEIAAIVPPAVSRWVLESALDLDLEVELVTGDLLPLRDDTPERCVWMRMYRAGGVSPSWQKALTDLPGAIVARPVGQAGFSGQTRRGTWSGVWVDVRCRAPVAPSLLAAMLPADESWLLGAADVGHRRLRRVGDPIAGDTLRTRPAPPRPAAQTFAALSGARAALPAPIPVRVIRSVAAGHRTTDAVLVDDRELAWLLAFERSLAPRDDAFVLPGDGRHLVWAAGRSGALPFGLPLAHIGPGALFIEQGAAFSPSLPRQARAACFDTDAGAVVVTCGEAYAFDATEVIPLWVLWAGDGPQLQRVGRGVAKQLEKLAQPFYRRPPERIAQPQPNDSPGERPSQPAPVTERQRYKLREKAARLELRGQYADAAQHYERAGDHETAARLYERSARSASASAP